MLVSWIFKIEPQTLQAIKANAHLLEKIAVERIQVEWIKLLLGKNVVQGLDAFISAGYAIVLQYYQHRGSACFRIVS